MNPVIFSLGFFEIRWYSVILLVAFLVASYFINKEAKRFDIEKDFIFNLIFWTLIFGFIGARIYYVIFDWNKQAEIEMQSNDFVAPQDVGTYLYVITAYFGKSEVNYVIKIEVESEI